MQYYNIVTSTVNYIINCAVLKIKPLYLLEGIKRHYNGALVRNRHL